MDKIHNTIQSENEKLMLVLKNQNIMMHKMGILFTQEEKTD